MADKSDYQKLLSEFIQKQMAVFGPNIVLDKTRGVEGLQVDQNGRVLTVSGDEQLVLRSLLEAYGELSEWVTRNVLDTLLAKYPNVKIQS